MTMLAAVGLPVTSIAFATACATPPSNCGAPPPPPVVAGGAGPGELVNLADWLAAGRIRAVNRQVTASDGGAAVRVTAAAGNGLIWLEGTDFAEGIIEADVCGRNVDSESFLGIAFRGRDDKTFEAAYLRPFNFRASDAARRGHAVQYIAEPDHDFSLLRQKYPEEFEHAVDPSIVPTAWIRLRVVAHERRVQVFAGQGDTPALDVRSLPAPARGRVGLFVGNGSDGVFANVGIVQGP
ncbi:MAG: hypothetical protein ABI603_05660 [Acidobacteriota bacterium]